MAHPWRSVIAAFSTGSVLVGIGACGLDWTVASSGASPGAASGAGDDGPGGGGGSGNTGANGHATGGPSSSSSSVSAGGASSSTASSASGGAPPCDALASCAACDDCSLDHECAAEWNACAANTDCSNLDACIYGDGLGDCEADLGDLSCIDDCYSDYPAAASLYDQLMDCILCVACPTNCQVYQAAWGGC